MGSDFADPGADSGAAATAGLCGGEDVSVAGAADACAGVALGVASKVTGGLDLVVFAEGVTASLAAGVLVHDCVRDRIAVIVMK